MSKEATGFDAPGGEELDRLSAELAGGARDGHFHGRCDRRDYGCPDDENCNGLHDALNLGELELMMRRLEVLMSS